MANENDSFIREVNEELRSDQFKGIWRSFGPYIIALAVLIVLGTAGYRAYEYWHDNRASASGDKFLAALTLAREGKNEEALAALSELEKDGYGSYPVLARMRAATVQAANGDTAAAAATFSALGKDTSVPEVIRDAARVRAAWLLIDTADYNAVSAEVEVLATPGNALRHSAREALGLSAYKAGDMGRAREWFEQIVEDTDAPRNVANRAQIMLDNITAAGGNS
ncbi:tetratricopeptide repeat protein [Ciceribacter sp. L1K22]|uniref:tetratricopeptide repeat protein n=1 Tax=Ciceribacter sp. L1K22 TaxID=2820275 RepID=UPI001ABDAD45|nr:tetratricopeptide repeat protein [Ciceribacter sp. L1K22]MBO3761163.1 tetratricopeptide repeat protein [Ciceribacter sp. L1K22]